MTSANLIVVLLVGAVVGALGGLGLGGVIHNPLHLGIIPGFWPPLLPDYFAISSLAKAHWAPGKLCFRAK